MLEHTPAPLGIALRPVRAGTARLAVNRPGIAHVPRTLTLHLPALLPDGAMSPRHTADGDGTSPAIYWDAVPAGTKSLVLLIEDADGPAPAPLLHAAAWNIAPEEGGLIVGALNPGGPLPMARNSFGRTGYTPIDAPTGHGVHRYVFQLLALSGRVSLAAGATRDQLIRAVFGRVLAMGEATATYIRPARRDNGLPTLALAAVIGGAAYAVARARRRRSERRAELRASAPVRFSPDVERIAPDETETFQRIADVMRAAAATARKRDGNAGRASHAKAHAIVTGAMTILPGLPLELAQGLFQPGRRYEVVARLAHVPGEMLDDRGPSTPRGFALKLLGVDGGATQDFLLDSGDPSFTAPNAKAFLAAITMTAAAAPLPTSVKAAVSAASRAGNAALNAVGVNSVNLDFYGHKPLHPLGETYFTQAPQRHGDFIAKYRIRPLSPKLRTLIDEMVKLDARDALRDAVIAWFAENPAEYVLEAQLCRDLQAMPVENANTEWDEDLSPYVPVAVLRFPRQAAWSPDHPALSRRLSFSPAHFIEAHRPLGSIQRARLYAYPLLAAERRALTGEDACEPRSLADLTEAPPASDRAFADADA